MELASNREQLVHTCASCIHCSWKLRVSSQLCCTSAIVPFSQRHFGFSPGQLVSFRPLPFCDESTRRLKLIDSMKVNSRVTHYLSLHPVLFSILPCSTICLNIIMWFLSYVRTPTSLCPLSSVCVGLCMRPDFSFGYYLSICFIVIGESTCANGWYLLRLLEM